MIWLYFKWFPNQSQRWTKGHEPYSQGSHFVFFMLGCGKVPTDFTHIPQEYFTGTAHTTSLIPVKLNAQNIDE